MTEFRIWWHFILPIRYGLVGADQRRDHGGETNRLGQFGFWPVVFALGVQVSRHDTAVRNADMGWVSGALLAMSRISAVAAGGGVRAALSRIKVREFLRAGFVSDQQQKGHFFKGGIRREIRDFVSAIDRWVC